jgi:hypothetical protein
MCIKGIGISAKEKLKKILGALALSQSSPTKNPDRFS